MINKIKMYKQTMPFSCGAASIMMILGSLGVFGDLTEEMEHDIYDQLVEEGSVGVSPSALVRFLESKGCSATISQYVKSSVQWGQKISYWIGKVLSFFFKTMNICIAAAADALCIAGISKEQRDYNNKELSAQELFGKIASAIDNGAYVPVIIVIYDSKKRIQGHHWMVGYGHDGDKVLFACPVFGRLECTAEELYDKMNSPMYGQEFVTVYDK